MSLSNLLIILGAVILALGLILHYAPWLINWFGKLPGDIYYQNEHSVIFIPFTSMIIISLLASLFIRWLGK